MGKATLIVAALYTCVVGSLVASGLNADELHVLGGAFAIGAILGLLTGWQLTRRNRAHLDALLLVPPAVSVAVASAVVLVMAMAPDTATPASSGLGFAVRSLVYLAVPIVLYTAPPSIVACYVAIRLLRRRPRAG